MSGIRGVPELCDKSLGGLGFGDLRDKTLRRPERSVGIVLRIIQNLHFV